MSRPVDEVVFADDLLNDWLSSVGLAVEYRRAVGNTLYFTDESGQEVAVLDHIGGFGALIFGHNEPEIIEYAKNCLDDRIPVLAQLSVQPRVNGLAAALNTILRRETGIEEPFATVFGNSGAEAVEICLKHAELERRDRIAALTEEIGQHIAEAREAVRAGRAVIAPSAGHEDTDSATAFESLVAEVEQRNAALVAGGPVYLALENAFHGKLVASIQLTQNPQWRSPFTALASSTRFLPMDRPGAIEAAVDGLRATLSDLTVVDGAVTVIERDFPSVGAFFVEPVQGANGMRPVPASAAREIRAVCDALGCPLVVDEIHSGAGRTGAFFASSHIGLRGDYYAVGKSLGGGITKMSAVLVRRDRFRPAFEVIHTSTFAKDGLSVAIGTKVLEMLEAEDGRAYRRAAVRGERLLDMLATVRADFPDIVAEVNGLGLMSALEFTDRTSSAGAIGEYARTGMLGYVLAGYILREHHIRVLPLGPAGNSVRFEPSIYLTDEEIMRTEVALREVCALLREEDGARLAPSATPEGARG
ncbi:aminotransferase class III-fold pyridoxal phosphate-dependent enzyme [Nocardia sp. AG03]|uniref:aspartate aminotransferase family protein n=1 Tax=Nocardia sp. AG03 TaxID=3025312 RepID=UPI0024181A09|nr:aminotransferase class III-fold pyridoxal phosphate-dependent enzyme [Nocardia sp. AG03]